MREGGVRLGNIGVVYVVLTIGAADANGGAGTKARSGDWKAFCIICPMAVIFPSG